MNELGKDDLPHIFQESANDRSAPISNGVPHAFFFHTKIRRNPSCLRSLAKEYNRSLAPALRIFQTVQKHLVFGKAWHTVAYLVALLLIIFQVSAQAQTQFTPNRNLALPPAAPGTWGEQYNNNFSTLDTSAIPRVTNATKPASPTANTVVVVTDALNASTCTTGGGSSQNTCQWNGSAWVVIGGGTGGGGSGTPAGADTQVQFNDAGIFGGDTGLLFNKTTDILTATGGFAGNVVAPLGQFNRFELIGTLTPPIIIADQDNYNPTGLSTASTLRISTTASRNITGLAGGSDGRIFTLHNIGSFNYTLVDESASSIAGNRFALTGNQTIPPDTSITLQYDSTSLRWRLLSSSSAATIDQTANYAWTGTHAFLSNSFSLLDTADPTKIAKFNISGFTAATTRTFTIPNASTRLIGDSDFALTGFMARTAANTYSALTLTGTANRISITNPTGGGNPTFNLGSLAVQTDQSNAFSTGDQNFANALSFTVPTATGAAPTLSGRFAYDSTSNRVKYGANGSTLTVATTAETQPLNANLTSLAALVGSNARVPYFTGASTFSMSAVPLCIESGSNHLNVTSLSPLTITCGTNGSGTGLTGMTTGKYLIATGATTADTSGSLSESGGVINAATGFTVGAAPFLIFDTSGIASTDKTWTVLNFSGTVRPSTGAFTAGHLVTTDANGLLIDGGAPGAGGTVTSVTISAPLSTTQAPITTSATLSCPTCVTSAAALTASRIVLGAGSQATSVLGSLGTTTTLLHGNAAGAPTFAAVSLTADVSGTLPVANGGTGTASTLVGLMRGNASAMTAAELSGDVTTSGSNATTIASNAVSSAKMAVVNTQRTCTIIVPGSSAGGVLVNGDFGVTIDGQDCFISAPSTLVEITVRADTGTPNIIPQRDRLGTAVDIVSSALATAAAGAQACSKTTGVTGLDGATTCSATLQNTSLSAGDWLGIRTGVAGGTAHRMSVSITYTVN